MLENKSKSIQGEQEENSGIPSDESRATSELKAAHTPAPWVFTEGYEGDETAWVIQTDEEAPWLIARMEPACDENDLPSGVEDRANALLVAAAPALYGFIREYVKNGCHHACGENCSHAGQQRMARARKVLALANGQAASEQKG